MNTTCTKDKKQAVALSSVFASAILTIFKFIVGIMTGSMGIMSEAAHSFLDLGSALITLFAVKEGDKKADTGHHYGHYKIENVSALIETGLLFLTSIWIIYEALKRLTTGNIEMEVTWYAFAIMFVSIIIDYSRSRALGKVAKETKSHALEADALHFSSDILSSIIVVTGLVLVRIGITRADSIAAIIVALFIMRLGYLMSKKLLMC